MTEFELNGQEFRIRNLPTLEQIKLARKLAPIIPPIAPAIMAAFRGDVAQAITTGEIDSVSGAFQPFADALSGLPDADFDYIIKTSLSCVLIRGAGEKWHAIAANGQIVRDDIDAQTLLLLTVHSIRGNLGDFTRGLVTKLMASPVRQEE